MGFLGFSTNPDLAAKISLFTALAPIARISYAKGLIALLRELVDLEGVLYWLLGNRQFDPPSAVSSSCLDKFSLCGYDRGVSSSD